MNGTGCQWSMYNSSSYLTQINDLRTLGGDVIISFGDWTADNGQTDLGNSCSTPDTAAAQIENVVTYFNVTHLDFDIESYALSNHTDVDRTNKALALVRSWAASNGRQLSISYTIPTFPTGLSSDGQYVLSNGVSNGFTPDVVNIMTMDYGTSGTEMGDASNQALDAVASQVASAYGKTLAQGYAMMGNTPMIGQNDSPGEIFTLADASSVESHAAAEGIALLTFWSEGRDNGGCPGQTSASSTCSGISQSTGQFTTTFQAFSGGTAPSSSPTPTPTATSSPSPTPTSTSSGTACAAPYDNSAVYVGGDVVSYNGDNWTAKWWTQGEAPSTGGSGVWQDDGACGGGTSSPSPTPTSSPSPSPSPTPSPSPSPSPSPTPTSSPSPSGSLVNGSFESGLSPWTCQPGSGVTTNPVHSGSGALLVAATASQTGECDQTITLAANTSYTLTGWVQGSYAYIGVSGGASATTWTSSSGWTQLSVAFTTGSSGIVTVFVHGWYGTGNVYADDLAVS